MEQLTARVRAPVSAEYFEQAPPTLHLDGGTEHCRFVGTLDGHGPDGRGLRLYACTLCGVAVAFPGIHEREAHGA